MNKKGSFGALVIIFFVIIILMLSAFGISLLFGTSTYIVNEISPVISDIGDDVGGANFSEISDNTVTPVVIISNSLGWLGGVGYMVALFMLLVLAFSFRITGQQWLIVVFLLFAVTSIFFSIFISNAYEDFYNGDDVIADQLKEQTLMSWLLLYSPLVTSVIVFIMGIIMFTGNPQGEFV